MGEGRDVGLEENFVVGVSGGRGRVINKNCWWKARELIGNVVHYL